MFVAIAQTPSQIFFFLGCSLLDRLPKDSVDFFVLLNIDFKNSCYSILKNGFSAFGEDAPISPRYMGSGPPFPLSYSSS